MPNTLGFPDNATMLFKFDKHVIKGREFPFATATEYQMNADRFLGGPLDTETVECFRQKANGTIGDRIRYNKVTQEYGILGNDNRIRSYYKPNPARHGKGTNYKYWQASCAEIRG